MTNTRRNFILASATAAAILPAQANPDIFQAAAAGDVPRATELATADPEIVRARSTDGRTPLHFATAAGKPEMVLFLLARGADLSAGPESPLLAAVDHPDHAIAAAMSQPLLYNASNPNARAHDGRTALHLAVARGHVEVVEMLIHRGAAITDEAAQLLPQASKIERVHFDRRYLQDVHGKPFTRDDTHGLPWIKINQFVTPAHFDFEKVKQLYKETPELLNARASWDELAIEAAAHVGQVPMAEWLAEKGAPVSTCTAVLLGFADRVKEALTADPGSLHERGAHDIAILSYTAWGKEQTAIAEHLLKAGVNVDSKGLNLTTLHLAAMKGYTELAALLIEKGADVNMAVKSKGEMMTPLAMAARAKHSKMEQLLKDKGAALN